MNYMIAQIPYVIAEDLDIYYYTLENNDDKMLATFSSGGRGTCNSSRLIYRLESYRALVKSKWSQNEPYNNRMEYVNCTTTNNGKYPIGCTVVGIA